MNKMEPLQPEQIELQKAASAFNSSTLERIRPLGDGLVHKSYHAKFKDGQELVIQQFNNHVFKHPYKVSENLERIVEALRTAKDYPLKIAFPVKTHNKDLLWRHDHKYWRAFHFISDSHEKQAVSSVEDVYMVGLSYGQFSRALCSLSPDLIHDTIPGFHDPISRLKNYQTALKSSSSALKKKSRDEINSIQEFLPILKRMHQISLPMKVTHNDAKLSNILFDSAGNPLAIIDLDTVMPGYSIFDFGDMVRSLANNRVEDDPNISQIQFQLSYYNALHEGFLEGGSDSLSATEIEYLPLGAKYLIFEQAMRFLTDYLEGSHYYKITFPEHNLIRTQNQLALLRDMVAKVS